MTGRVTKKLERNGKEADVLNFGHRRSTCLGWTQRNHRNYEVRTPRRQAHLNSPKTSPKQSNGTSHLTAAFCITAAQMKPPHTQLRGKGARGSGGPQTYRILKFFGDFFGLYPILSTVFWIPVTKSGGNFDNSCNVPPPPLYNPVGAPTGYFPPSLPPP